VREPKLVNVGAETEVEVVEYDSVAPAYDTEALPFELFVATQPTTPLQLKAPDVLKVTVPAAATVASNENELIRKTSFFILISRTSERAE
jgi:hypothetical protein